MTLALDGGTPVRRAGWPSWPPAATAEQRELLLEVLDSGAWGATSGTKVTEFAGAFAHSVGAQYGVVVVNGTVALFLALRALGVGTDDEVIVPAYTFVASATAVILAGARPVIADVTPDTLHLDPASAERLIGPRTKAIMPVHLAGAPADADKLGELARVHDLAIVEDAAQAHGAAFRGRPAGTLGDAACFSFQSSKAMTAGEGGLIVTDDLSLYQRLWSLHNVGRSLDGGWYEHPEVGWNLRMTEFQAAVLLPQLALLGGQLATRERAITFLERELKGFDGLALLPEPAGTTRNSRHLAMLRYDARAFGGRGKADFVAAMTAEGVPLDAGYRSLSREAALRPYGVQQVCPVAESAEESVVWIRQHLLMADEQALADIITAAEKVRQAFAS
ncbi:dTDP-4-amino-4,6-dideoxygalactose transaminase [Kribbella sp. VKM Ac-2527]|uniref:dTDP-4-amino-4,6-dideoxygalactose transaminase n=1 Tax=Kribbella caucasensis TaxID=2512215 RepID=A0A4R6JNQ1_9ACTN|nr:DegT/DnrJ/EryC1/StrS family aminotransferase [Kribbella sp. VKM Ac-2527]TDO36376.1 dTDP-4-amino-4,6-dideoxygalactose transaminase [Kribbella sp. VKM Ac-2527]